MPKLLLCRLAFTDPYVAAIRAEIPADQWHVIETWRDPAAVGQQPDVVILVSGSKTHQKISSVRLRFGGGAAAGAFDLPLKKLASFLREVAGKCQK